VSELPSATLGHSLASSVHRCRFGSLTEQQSLPKISPLILAYIAMRRALVLLRKPRRSVVGMGTEAAAAPRGNGEMLL
jgi:hypothetical protein